MALPQKRTRALALLVGIGLWIPDLEQVHAFVPQTQPDVVSSSSSYSPSPSTTQLFGMVEDLQRKLKHVARTGFQVDKSDKAALSASLYMNPAASKIAANLKVSWEPDVAETLLKLRKIGNPNRPFLVGVVGIPGSGKSTSCEILAQYLGEDKAFVMPMDGYHYPMAELEQFPDAADAIYRRGAPDTFDPVSLARDLEEIVWGQKEVVSIPGFDHAIGDPEPDQHTFERTNHSVVICEGIYLLYDNDGWEKIQKYFDWTIYIESDVDVCVERLKERNKSIPGYTPEEIDVRCEAVDRVNAETATESASRYASQIVKSAAL